MAVTARRSRGGATKKAPVVDEEEEEDEHDDYQEEDGDEEEDDDDDFEFGQDEDEDEEDEEDESISGILEGNLVFDETEQLLHYQGNSFHLSANMKKDDNSTWNPLMDPPPPSSSNNMATFQMKGTLQSPGLLAGKTDADAPQKLPLRTFDVTWTIQHYDGGAPPVLPAGKSCGDDDDDDDDDDKEDGKQKASPKRPALFYSVVGREVNAVEANIAVEFQGGFYPPKTPTKSSVPLNCQFKYVLSESSNGGLAVAAAAAVAKPAAAAAAAATISNNGDDDEEDDDNDADEEMGYDELIALHQDAGMDVEALKRRYQQPNNNGKSNDDDNDGKPSAKRSKTVPDNDEDDDDDDDDDELGF